MTQVQAKLRYIRIAPKKVRSVANLLKGLPVSRAEAELLARPQKSSTPLRKLLRSAVANAEHNFQLSKSNLYVSKVVVDAGPSFKRMLPRAFGRATPLLKRTSHVTIVLESREKGVAPEETVQAPMSVIEEKRPIVETVTKVEVKPKRGVKPVLKRERDLQSQRSRGFAQRLFRRKAI